MFFVGRREKAGLCVTRLALEIRKNCEVVNMKSLSGERVVFIHGYLNTGQILSLPQFRCEQRMIKLFLPAG